jgi:hypothetical protein
MKDESSSKEKSLAKTVAARKNVAVRKITFVLPRQADLSLNEETYLTFFMGTTFIEE